MTTLAEPLTHAQRDPIGLMCGVLHAALGGSW
jgi:hypothetical protein